MLPGVGPGAVGQRIADGIVFNFFPVIGGQKIAPCGIGIAIEYRICGSPQFVIVGGGVGILFPVYDVACGIIGPGPGFSQLLVVLPDQLVGSIVDIACGIGTVTDCFLSRAS